MRWRSASRGRTEACSGAWAADAPSTGSSTLIATRVNTLSNRLIATATATYGRLGLGFLDARILYALAREPGIRAAEIGRRLKVDAAALSRSLKPLRDGAVITETGSKRLLCLTAKGWGIYEQVNAVAAERERRLFAGFSEQEAAFLADHLERMLANIPELSALSEKVPELLEITGALACPSESTG
jgi:DNA-binding MarR family transcriptional regulator